jgi:uncharacterized protein involved in cysteine biosynthesis
MLPVTISRTFHTLSQPYFLRLLMLSIGVTLGCFLLLSFAAGMVFQHVSLFQDTWLDRLADVAGTLMVMAAGWFLFPIVVPLIAIVFQEQVANQIDREEYGFTPESSLPLGPELVHGLKLSLLALGLNLACLPLYFTVILFPVAYYSLNGYLLGREFFEMIAAREKGRPAATALRKRYATRVFTGGVLIVLMSTLPLINLIAPFAGIALMTHLYRATSESAPL